MNGNYPWAGLNASPGVSEATNYALASFPGLKSRGRRLLRGNETRASFRLRSARGHPDAAATTSGQHIRRIFMPDTCSFSCDASPALWQLIQGRVVAVRASASGRGPCLTRCASPCGYGHLLVLMFDVERAREITLRQPLGRANGFPCCQLSWLTKALRRDVVSAQLASAPSAAVARPLHYPPTTFSREKPH